MINASVKYHQSIVILFIVSFPGGMTTAQQPYFQEETAPSALSEIKHVTGIAADKNSCIWFATQTGIYRYDGTHLKHYSVLNTPVLKFERMGFISRLKSKHDERWSITDGKDNEYEVDSSSRLQPFWLRNDDSERVTFRKFCIEGRTASENNRIDTSLKEQTYETYSTPASGTLYLVEMNGDIISMRYADLFYGAKGSLLYSFKKQQTNKVIATDRNFYVISAGGLLRWKGNSTQPESVQLSGDILDKKKSINFNDLVSLKTAESTTFLLWLEGNIYEAIESAVTNILQTRLLIRDAGKEYPVNVFYSREQKLFINYFPDRGMVLYRPKQFSLLSWNSPETSIIPDYYYSLLTESNGFVTVNDRGVVWLGINGEKKMLTKDPALKFFLFKDRSGNIWYQRKVSNLICYMQAGTKRSIPFVSTVLYESLTGVYQADDSIYYILTNRGLKKFITKKGVVQSQQILYNAKAHVDFNALYVLNPGSFWLASDQGLLQFNVADRSIKNIVPLDGAYVRAITRIGENNYLVGTYDKGIYQYKNNGWIHLSSPGRMMPASAHAFIIDTLTSSVWVSSNEGILRLSLPELLAYNKGDQHISFRHFTNFGPGISAEFNGSSNTSAARISDSCFAFANAKGIVTFNPLRLVSYPLPVTVLAESVEKTDDPIPIHNPYQIEFNPVIPYFGDREDLDVLYRLSNSNDNWHKLSSNSIVSYNNVSPGHHDLQFRINNYGEPGGKEVFFTASRFTIPYRWFQQPWFQVVAALFILLLVIVIHNLRIWYLRKRKKELEQLVKQKTRELQETNENLVTVITELGASETSLKQSNFLKDEYYAVLTHDLRSPLKFLSFNLSQLLELLPELTNQAMKKGLLAACQSSNDVYKLVDEFVYWIQDNEKQLRAKALPTLIYAVINDIKKLYGFSFESNGNTLIAAISPELRFSTDPKMLFIVLRNAVDNANKYTVNGTITVSASLQNSILQLIVSDTGKGMNSEMVQELTDLQYRKEQLDYKQRKSLGFYIMAMLTKKLGGSYTITSVKGEGISICFMLPQLAEE